jgi:hypothetical protein
VNRVFLFGPIPSPETWVMATEAPPGYLKLCSLSIKPRARMAGCRDLIPSDALLRSQLARLLEAYKRLDEAARIEVLKVAELLAGTV